MKLSSYARKVDVHYRTAWRWFKTRFGFRYIETLLEQQGCRVEVVNLADDGKEDLLEDWVSIIYSFCARLYGLRRAKRKTERIVKQLGANGNEQKD